MSTAVQRCDVDFRGTIKFTKLSRLNRDLKNNLTTAFAGNWKISLVIPVDSNDADAWLELWIFSPKYWTLSYGPLEHVSVSLSLQSFDGHELRYLPFNWDHEEFAQKKSSISRGFVKLITWKEFWADNATTQRDDGVCLHVEINSKPPSPRLVLSESHVIRNIAQQISGEDVIDTKFLLFSRHRDVEDATGAAGMLPVYANSSMIEGQCDYFKTMLSDSKFFEGNLVNFDQPPSDEQVDEYDYESDSDLGYFSEDEEKFDEDDWRKVDPVSDDGEQDLCGTDDGHDVVFTERPQSAESDSQTDKRRGKRRSPQRSSCSHGRVGKVVVVKDMAYVTWKAMIFYLCTSQIKFAPLTSLGKSKSRSRTPEERAQCRPSRPSPKSMYRLADKLGLEDLCRLSLINIRSQLSKDIIIQEVFSSFSARYKPIQDLQLSFLAEHWSELKTSQDLRDKIAQVARGDLPHAVDVLMALLSCH